MKAHGKATPRRPIEREYLATLNAAVPLDTSQAICKRAADLALIVERWPGLPEAIRVGVVAMVRAVPTEE